MPSESDVGPNASVADRVISAVSFSKHFLCNGFNAILTFWTGLIFLGKCWFPLAPALAGISFLRTVLLFCVICYIHFAACALWGFNLSADPFKSLAAEARDVCIQFLRAQATLRGLLVPGVIFARHARRGTIARSLRFFFPPTQERG